MQHQIQFGSRYIEFTVYFRERKTLGIKVKPDGEIEVLAPLTAGEEKIFAKVRLKAPWILKQIDYFNSYKPLTPPRRFINGETHLYMGRQYRLKIVPDKEDKVKAFRGQLLMHSRDPRPEKLELRLGQWYKQKALVVFYEILQGVLPKFKRYGIPEPTLTIRTMSKRWGSCTKDGQIILNLELAKTPKGCIEYVIIHELCHLIYHNHTRAFKDLLGTMLPDWRKWKDRLEGSLA